MKDLNRFISEYFFRARDIVSRFNENNSTTIQFFQRKDNVVFAGITEVLELLKEKLQDSKPTIKYLPEGTEINAKDVVLEITGRYQDFGIYEGIIDGILSRATSIATNARNCVLAAQGKEVICMSDRSDHYCNQERDGKAMLIGGIISFSSFAQSPSSKYRVYGSIPHALIQNLEGDILKSMEYYYELFPHEELIFLADFNNDVIGDSLKVLKHFGKKLFGVRVDTSAAMRDTMFSENEDEFGVTPNQIKRLRKALDEAGGEHVKITVSSGFTPEKIKKFEDQKTPVDAYGVGEYLLKINHGFCADAVVINGKAIAKAGRGYRENKKLVEYR